MAEKGTDLSQVFLSGDSAGGNIVHQVAIRAIRSEGFRGRLKGLLPIHPYFGSEKRTELEMADGSAGDVEMNDMFWRLSLPQGSNRDYFGCKIKNAELSVAEWSEFPAVIAFVAGSDFLKERGVTYTEFLNRKGVKRVELVEAEGQEMVVLEALSKSILLKLSYAGSNFKSIKYRIDELNEKTFTYKYTLIEGEALIDKLEKITCEVKFEQSADGGSISKVTSEYHTEGDFKLNEEEIKAGKEKVLAMYKAVEAYLLQNPDVCFLQTSVFLVLIGFNSFLPVLKKACQILKSHCGNKILNGDITSFFIES
ncbi:hypothetical protein K7X08_029566 [Anisodus acutangulus]|uniref:Alpha/beta hydrolase fold-3 domain-containing protein n=1 Tax=Anisodus acutangulus TaxID=402998 RepID=A0A9Q1QU95_9SOLA|nr:hypothetical protein K7X08_029566 [Anisodus acutangulus]